MSTTAYLIFAAIAVIGVIILYAKGRIDGAKLERNKGFADDAEARDIADQVENDVGAMSPEQVKSELEKWSKR